MFPTFDTAKFLLLKDKILETLLAENETPLFD